MTSIKQKTIDSMLWSVSERVGTQVILTVITIILARLLDVADFGLLGMMGIFVAVAIAFTNSGFGNAYIQKENVDDKDASSIFIYNLFIGSFLTIILFLSAPLISQFFSQPKLTPITRVLSTLLIIDALSMIHRAWLTKRMEFRIQAKIYLVAISISGIIAIGMAYFGFGVWSLVAQLLVRHTIISILLWILTPWRPSLTFSLDSIKSIYGYGSRLLISGLVEVIFKNLYQTFIGRFYTADDLGYYNKADSFGSVATQPTSSSLTRVSLAAMSPYQKNNSVLKKSYRKMIRFSLFFHFPLMIGLIATANPILLILLTDKWAQSIPYFQLMCVIGLFLPIDTFNMNIQEVKGRTDILLRSRLIVQAAIIVSIALTYRYGIEGLLYGQIAVALFSFIIFSHPTKDLIGYSQLEQIKDMLALLIPALLSGGIMFIIGRISFPILFIKLICQITAGIASYVVLNILIGSNELNEYFKISLNYLHGMTEKIEAWKSKRQ